MTEVLSSQQIEFYRDQGYLVLEAHIPDEIVDECVSAIDALSESARGMTRSDNRLDLEDSHRPERPRIRRIKLPHTQSPVFEKLVRSDAVLAPVRDLIGPNLRLKTSKLNLKSAEYGAPVEWHQDWAFYPHTNDDVLAVGVMLNDTSAENGPLMVFPGSHKGPVHDHHSNGVFVGAMTLGSAGLDSADAVMLTGPRGTMSIHHARLVHGSALNRSDRDRHLILYEITAADAFPIMGSTGGFASLAEYDAQMLCGQSTKMPRLAPVPVRIPQPMPENAGSIYEMQGGMSDRMFSAYQPAAEPPRPAVG